MSIYSRVKSNDPALKVFRIDPESKLDRWKKDDLVELGADISLNTSIERLVIDNKPNQALQPLPVPPEIRNGFEQNTSICDLRLSRCVIIPGPGEGNEHENVVFPVIDIVRMFRDKGNLRKLSVQSCLLQTSVHRGTIELLASTIDSCKRLNYISLTQCIIADAQLGRIIGACRDHGELKVLELSRNNIGRKGCEALASLLRRPNCNIITLCLDKNNRIDDDCVATIADSLTRNKVLTKLYLESCERITRVGWLHLCRAMCDTTTINATYSSNHTLRSVGESSHLHPVELVKLFNINLDSAKRDRELSYWRSTLAFGGKRQAAIEKILLHHRRLDMEPFFGLDLKLLPFVVTWFDDAEECTMFGTGNGIDELRARKLDAFYQFARSMPMIFVENRPSKRWPLAYTTYLSICVAIFSDFAFWACVAIFSAFAFWACD